MSLVTQLPLIQERSEATPGLWNTIFAVVGQNFQQLNTDTFGVISVMSYGARGDNVFDDTTRINAAAQAATGNILYFPVGTYKITSAITVLGNTMVLMQPGASVVQYTESQQVFSSSGVSTVKFRDCVLDYNTVVNRQTIGALHLVGCTDFEIIGCRIVKSSGMGMYTANNRSGRILANSVKSTNADGIHITNGGSSNMSSHDISVVNNICDTTGDDSIAVVSYTAGSPAINEAITITGNVVSNCSTRGITVAGGRGISVTANTIRLNRGPAGINIMLDDVASTYSAQDILVANNVIQPASGAAASTRHGLNIYRSHRVIAIDNIIDWRAGEGIMLYGLSTDTCIDCQLVHNLVSGNTTLGEQGIHTKFTSELLLQGNHVINATKSGLYCENFDKLLVLNNIIDEANQQNVGTTNLVNLINGQRAHLVSNVLDQSTTAFQHGYSLSQISEVYSAQNILRRTVAMSGSTANANSCASADLWDFSSTNAAIPQLHLASDFSLGLFQSGRSALGLSYGQFQLPADTTSQPGLAWSSESSLGFFRSGASHLGMSYGGLAQPAGTALLPSYAFSSESSLGFYSSAASVVQQSYGTLWLSSLSVTGPAWINTSALDQLRVFGGGNNPVGIGVGRLSVEAEMLCPAGAGQFMTNTAAGDAVFRASNTGTFVHIGVGGGVAQLKVSGSTVSFNVPVQVTNGTSVTPSLMFTSESSLGFYRSGASVLALSYGGLGVKAGANASIGTAVLGSNGSVNVANTYVAAGDLIFLTDQTAGGTLGDIELGGIRAGSGFTIQSTSVTDTSTVAWMIVRPT